MIASGLRSRVAGVGAGVLAVAVVTTAIELLDAYAPVLSLGVLYVFAVLPIALFWGTTYAIAVAVASMLAFNFLFLPPLYTFTLAESENWVALAVYLVSAVVVGELASRARLRATEAEQREREAAFLARSAGALLESTRVQDELSDIAGDLGRVLGVDYMRIEWESTRRENENERAVDLEAGGRHVGRVFFRREASVDTAVAERVLPGLASLLAVAGDRERLARRAVDAETLRRSDAVKTAILRTVSHDLRSPLTAIRASVEALANPALELSALDRANLVEAIATETQRLGRLVENLLDLSRLEVGAANPHPELFTLDDLVGRTLAELGSGAARVSITLPADVPIVRVDGVQIERVLFNLLDNALKYSLGDVQLTAVSAEEEVLVRVTDEGPGISQAELGRIFEPFEHGRVSESARGAGLGLAIARGFAQANGGVLWAESTDDAGAAFVLSLPLATTSERLPA